MTSDACNMHDPLCCHTCTDLPSARIPCSWQVVPFQPGLQAVHWMALVQAVQCPPPIVTQLAQLPAAEQYCPTLQDVAVQGPAEQVRKERKIMGACKRKPTVTTKSHSLLAYAAGRWPLASQTGRTCTGWRWCRQCSARYQWSYTECSCLHLSSTAQHCKTS